MKLWRHTEQITLIAAAFVFNCDPAASFCAFSRFFFRAFADLFAFPPPIARALHALKFVLDFPSNVVARVRSRRRSVDRVDERDGGAVGRS